MSGGHSVVSVMLVLFCYCFPCLCRSGGHSVVFVKFSLLWADPRRCGGHSVVLVMFCYCFPCLGRSGGHSVVLVLFSLPQAGLGRPGGHSVVLVMFCVVLLLFSLPRHVWWSFCVSAGLVVILLFW